MTAVRAQAAREQSRARYPDSEGYVERDGVRVFYEVYGEGDSTILLLPTWSIVHSRLWKAQIPYLARHARVVTFDGRGNGRSDRPAGVEPYLEDEFAADTLAVMDATGTERATLITSSCGALWGTIVAADHPERVDGVVYIGPAVGLAPGHPERQIPGGFDAEQDDYEGWRKYNSHYWSREYRDFLEFFFAQCFPRAALDEADRGRGRLGARDRPRHARRHDPGDLALPHRALPRHVRPRPLPRARDPRRRRPDPPARAGGRAGRGDRRQARDARGRRPPADGPRPRQGQPAAARLRSAARRPHPGGRRGRRRRRRALFVSSPIGLGHAQRDAAIADELRLLHPDLEIDWLAQHPVTSVLEARGERIHPASAHLASESTHIECESAEHDLHVFQAWRRMDEILVSNFMVFHDLVRDDPYDLWIGDEAWELDYFLHENPELKSAAYVWLTDFVGWLPMPDGGEREAFLTADYNAEMIEHIDRYPRLRDRALFVGDPDDIVPHAFGPELPAIRDWTERHFDFPGYITGFDPADFADRERLRAELGYRPGRGGLRRHRRRLRRRRRPAAARDRRVPGGEAARAGAADGRRRRAADRPALAASARGLEVHAYVHDLYRHLAACDLAIVQGGLTTAMELAANRRPFLYFPLRHHFEQNSTSPTGSSATAPAAGWTSRPTARRRSRARSPRRSAARSTTCPSTRRRARRAAAAIAELL